MARGWVSHGAPAIAVSSLNKSIDANELYQHRPMAHSRKEIDSGETLTEILLDILPIQTTLLSMEGEEHIWKERTREQEVMAYGV